MKLSISALALLASSSTHAFSPIMARSRMATSTMKSFHTSPSQLLMTPDSDDQQLTPSIKKEPKNPTPVLMSWMDNNNMKMAAVVMACALALAPLNADAAQTGGRMGGSFSAAPRQSISRPARSSSYGYSGYSRPSTTIITPGYSPFMSPIVTPYYGGPGVITYSRGPGLFDLLFVGGFLFVVANIFSKAGTEVADGASAFGDVIDSASSSLGAGTSVVQMSVALEVPNRDDPNSILGALDRLARTARTDSRVGIQNLTSQVALELLRRRSSITSATSSYQTFRNQNKASRDFQAKSIKERSKFEREVVSKYGGVDYSEQGANKDKRDGDKATMAVVTIILSIDGDSTKVPEINSIADVENALRKIASDAKVDDCLQSAEILWTPEDRSETLTRGDVVADYPELRAV